MDPQVSHSSSDSEPGGVTGPNINHQPFRVTKAALRLFDVVCCLFASTYMSLFFVTYKRNVYMDIHVPVAAALAAVSPRSPASICLCLIRAV